MKKSIAIVKAHKETGNVITMREITNAKGETEEVGTVMVQSTEVGNLSGIGSLQTRTAFITLRKEVIDHLEGQIVANKPFPVEGKIQIVEKLEPYVSKSGKTQEPKINPSTGEVITYQNQPVYRNMVFTQDMNAQDVYLRDVAGVEVEVEEEEAVE